MASIRSFLKKSVKFVEKVDPLAKAIHKATEKIPGSPGALTAAVKSDASTNPFSNEASVWDTAALGTKLAQNEKVRTAGRAAGAIAALYFGVPAAYGALGGGASAGAATTGAAGAATAAAPATASAGILGTGITTGHAVSAGLAAYGVAQQRAAAKAAEEAMQAQSAAFDTSLQSLRSGQPQTPTLDEARRRAEQSDALRRKRGRRASILTGDSGVGPTPISQRTLIGS